MLIDTIFLVIIVIAVIKGLRKGLIVALFSMIALIIGLAAAMKLSATVAGYMKDTVNVSARWLPVLSFLAVFIIVVLLVRWGGGMIQAAVDAVWLGWVNKLGGILFYIILYLIIFSVLLFFATQVHLLSTATTEQSKVYPWIQPWGPYVINSLGKIIPFFKDMFAELSSFFAKLSA